MIAFDGLEALLGLTSGILWAVFLVFLRMGALVSVMPAFGTSAVPMRIKLGVALALTAIVTPAVYIPPEFSQYSLDTLVLAALTETVNGLLLGIGLRLILIALQTAGSMAAQATSLAQILGAAGVDPMPAMGQVLVVGAYALAMILGLHVRVAEMLILSYSVLPMGQFPDPSSVSEWGVSQVAKAFAMGFTLAAPFIIVSVLYNLTLGIINRAMPQLMVVFVGAPVITMGGLFLLMLLAPLMLGLWSEALFSFIANPFKGP